MFPTKLISDPSLRKFCLVSWHL